MADAIKVLEGAQRVTPTWNDKAQTWNYDIPGRDIEGQDLTIRIAPTDDGAGTVLVTGF